MRHLSKVLLLGIALTVIASVQGADRIRANYQLDVHEGSDLKRVQMASDVVPGTPIEYDLAKYRLSMSIDIGPSNTYVLTVWLAPVEAPKDVLVKRSFDGSFVNASVGPLEFEVEQNGVRVSGAMAISSVTQ
jgi:hypothetical protein